MPGALGSSEGASLAAAASSVAKSVTASVGAGAGSDLQPAKPNTAPPSATNSKIFFTENPLVVSPNARDTGSGKSQRAQNSHKFRALSNGIKKWIVPQLGQPGIADRVSLFESFHGRLQAAPLREYFNLLV